MIKMTFSNTGTLCAEAWVAQNKLNNNVYPCMIVLQSCWF